MARFDEKNYALSTLSPVSFYVSKKNFGKTAILHIINSVKSQQFSSKNHTWKMDKQIGIPTGMLVASAKRLVYFESHQIITKKYEMKIDGHLLFDQIQKVKVIPKKIPDDYKFTILHHTRGIDGKTLKVTKIYMPDERSDLISRKIDTNMTQEELKQFQTDWTRLWRPKINKN